LEKQIHTLDERGTSRQIHPFGFHRLIKFPRWLINGGRSSLTRVRGAFKIKANSRTFFPKHGTDYCFQMDKLESRLASSKDSRTFATTTSLSASLAKVEWQFLPVLEELQEHRSLLWRTGLYGQFGTARGVLAAFLGSPAM